MPFKSLLPIVHYVCGGIQAALNQPNNQSDLIDLTLYWRYFLALIKNWYVFVPITIAFTITSYIYIHKVEDMYQSETQLLLKAEETYDYQSAIYRGLGAKSGGLAVYEHVASQIRVIRSSSILNRVLDKLNLDVSYFITGRLKTSEIFTNLPFRVESQDFDANRIRQFNLTITSRDGFELTYIVDDVERKIEAKFGALIAEDGIFLSVHRNSSLTDLSPENLASISKVKYSFRLNRRSQLLGKYKSAIDLKNLEYTSVVSISIRDNIPERAKMFLDTLGLVYIDYSQQNKVDINENTLRYINKQTEEVQDIIRSIGSEIEQYKDERSILNITREEDFYFRSFVDYEQKLDELNRKGNSIQELITYISNLSEKDVTLPPSLIMLRDDGSLIKLVNELYEYHLQRLNLLGQIKKENPEYIKILERIDGLRTQILIYLTETQEFLDKEIADVENDIKELESKIKFIPKDNRELLNIEKRLQVNEELYSFLLSRKAETIIARAAIVPEVKVIEAPRVSGIVFPDRQAFVMQWAGIGIILGLAFSFIKVFFFDKITSKDSLDAQTDKPVLGIVPVLKEKEGALHLIYEENMKSPLFEAFRALRANLELMGNIRNRQTILVTSLHPGEGKSFSSVNMAYMISRVKKKVLLIDCDLHKPKIHKIFKVNSGFGLSNVLTGTKDVEDVIYKHDEHFHVMFSGPQPPNASELVASDDFSQMIDKLKGEYDAIVIDTPPLGIITDALTMMKLVDVKLYILNTKFATKRALRHLEEVMERGGESGAAIVLNYAKKSFSRYYTGAYRYYYGYAPEDEQS